MKLSLLERMEAKLQKEAERRTDRDIEAATMKLYEALQTTTHVVTNFNLEEKKAIDALAQCNRAKLLEYHLDNVLHEMMMPSCDPRKRHL